jgi:hypothetical protein
MVLALSPRRCTQTRYISCIPLLVEAFFPDFVAFRPHVVVPSGIAINNYMRSARVVDRARRRVGDGDSLTSDAGPH